MPYCPKCRGEFQDWVKVCPDCNVNLVAELPPLTEKVKKKNDPLVPIATAPNEITAKMWEDILKGEGIRCMLGSSSPGAASQTLIFYAPITILVLLSEAKRAKQILAPFLEE
jgi:hypothetical protein